MLKIHFLNVGKGDCTIIEHPSGRISMIDINNSKALDEDSMEEIATNFLGMNVSLYSLYKSSGMLEDKLKEYTIDLIDPIEYYKDKFPKRSIFRFIVTHPDMDHLSGLWRLRQEVNLGNMYDIVNFWDTKPDFEKGDFENGRYDENDWEEYLRLRNGERGQTILKLNRGASGKYYNQDNDQGEGLGDVIHILAPTPELEEIASEDNSPNDVSYALLVEYGDCRIVLGGDANSETSWESIYDYFQENEWDMSVDILKASHHGRKSGYHQPSVKEMSPQYTIVSTGQKDKHDASQLYGQYSLDVLSTRWWGNIIAKCYDNGFIQVVTERNRRDSDHIDPETGYWILP